MVEKEVKKEEKISEETVVVEAIPSQPVRSGLSEDGKTMFNLVTRDEALTEILTLVREIKKGLG